MVVNEGVNRGMDSPILDSRSSTWMSLGGTSVRRENRTEGCGGKHLKNPICSYTATSHGHL